MRRSALPSIRCADARPCSNANVRRWFAFCPVIVISSACGFIDWLFGLTALNPTAAILSLLRLPGTVTMSRRAKYLTSPTEELAMSTWNPVYQVVKQIPRGRVLSYGALARILHLRGGARSAGRAMAATPPG